MGGTGPLIVLLASANVAVVEVRVEGERASQAFARELASGIGAPPPEHAAQQIAQRLWPIASQGKMERVIEADRLVQSGRDLYLDGRFAEAASDLLRAREILTQTIESFEEERRAAEALFRADMYLAFTLRGRGGDNAQQATEVLRDAVRTFPSVGPNYSEYGPENLKLYKQVRNEMDRMPMARIRVQAGLEPTSVYLNGRLIGVTPLDIDRVYPGHYRVLVRRGKTAGRIHEVDIRDGDNDVRIDVDFDQALRSDGELTLVYRNAAERHRRYQRHAAEIAKLLSAEKVLLFWNEGSRRHLALVDESGTSREIERAPNGAVEGARELLAGRIGEPVVVEEERPRRIWTWVTAGAAVATLAGGIALGISASNDFDTLNQRYSAHVLDGPGIELRDSANTKQTIGNVLIDVSIAAVISSAVLYWYEGRTVPRERAIIVPVTSPQFAGAELRMEF